MKNFFIKNRCYRIVQRVICFILVTAILFSQINVVGIEVQAKDKDYVKITAVTPNYYCSYNTEMTFTATIEYQLASMDHGIVYLGFNTDEPHGYHLYAQQEVEAGKGTVTLQATVTPVDWGSYWKAGQHVLDWFKGYSSMETDFKIYANLSEYPHDESWDPLAIYEYPLKYMTTEAEQLEPELFWDKTNGHEDENEVQDLNNNVTSPDTVYKREKFDNSLEELCSMSASTTYNPQLSYMLMTLASGAYYKQCSIKNYDALGFLEGDYHTYNYFKEPDDDNYKQDSVAYTIGEKMTWDGRRMILIVIRGSFGTIDSMSPDWRSNFNLGEAETSLSWHEGFETAAKEVFGSLKSLYGDKLPTNNTFYVVTGHSRGAGVANLLSMLLSDNGVPKLNVYDYNFACPDVARNSGIAWNWLGDHDNIFNVGNANDPVTWIPGFLGDLLGNASDTAVSLFSLITEQNLELDGADNNKLATPMTDWGKFGRSYWFSEDWDKSNKDGLQFEDHEQENYMSYLKSHSGDSFGIGNMVTWEEIFKRSTIGQSLSAAGLLLGMTGLVWLVLCPVDVNIYDTEGNILASVIDGEIDYHNSSLEDVIILTEGDHKLIFVRDGQEADIELVGTDKGIMNYAVMKVNISSENIENVAIYENIELTKGKYFKDYVELKDFQNNSSEISSNLRVVNRWGNEISEVQKDGHEIAVKGSFIANLTDQIWLMVIIGIILLALIGFGIVFFTSRKGENKKNNAHMYGSSCTLSSGNTRGAYGSSLGGLSCERQVGDILCSCGTVNPAGVRTCMGCGKKLKKRR